LPIGTTSAQPHATRSIHCGAECIEVSLVAKAIPVAAFAGCLADPHFLS
jgi:hypothetical protein